MSQKSLVEMARTLRRARMPVVRPSTQVQVAVPTQPAEEENVEQKPVYGATLDSWEPRYRITDEKPVNRNPTKQNDRGPAKTIDRLPAENVKPQETKSEKSKKVPELIVEEEIENESGFVATTRTAKRMVEKKARTMSLSISVSKEEARILRQHASEMNTTFSLWARSVLFRAAGRRMPARPRRVE